MAATCVVLSAAAFLNPDPTQFVVLVAAVALVAVVVVSSSVVLGSGRLVTGSLSNIAFLRAGTSATEQARGVVRLVLLAQPRC
jgi:hypothetical protein